MGKNKLVLVFLLFSILLSAYALAIAKNELSIRLDIDAKQPAGQQIQGSMSITAGELSSEEPIKIYINNNKKAEIQFKEALDLSSIDYTIGKPDYSINTQVSSSNSKKILGFNLPGNIASASI